MPPNPPTLTGEFESPLAHLGVIAVGEGHHCVVQVGQLGHFHDLLLTLVHVPVAYVVPEAVVEQHRLLRHHSETPPQRFQVHLQTKMEPSKLSAKRLSLSQQTCNVSSWALWIDYFNSIEWKPAKIQDNRTETSENFEKLVYSKIQRKHNENS